MNTQTIVRGFCVALILTGAASPWIFKKPAAPAATAGTAPTVTQAATPARTSSAKAVESNPATIASNDSKVAESRKAFLEANRNLMTDAELAYQAGMELSKMTPEQLAEYRKAMQEWAKSSENAE